MQMKLDKNETGMGANDTKIELRYYNSHHFKVYWTLTILKDSMTTFLINNTIQNTFYFEIVID